MFTDTIEDDIPVNNNHLSPLENDLPAVCIVSFGIRRGPLSPPPDLSIDLRSLPNPPKHIRTGHTGLSKQLRDWLFTDNLVEQRFQRVRTQVQECLDEAKANGQTQVVVGVNCEIGKHRSVAFVEELGRQRFDDWNVITRHRDVHLKRSVQKHRHHRDRSIPHETAGEPSEG